MSLDEKGFEHCEGEGIKVWFFKKDVKQFIKEIEVDIANPTLTSLERMKRFRKRAGEGLI